MNTPPRQTIESESLRALLQAGRWIWTIHIPAVSVAVGFLWHEPFRANLLIWYFAYCAMVFLQRWYCVKNIDRLIDPELTKEIFWPFTVSSIIIGALWGILGMFFFPTEVALQYLITLLIGGAALAAVATLHFSAITLSATLITALPWLGLRHLLEGNPQSIFVGLLVWLFLGLLIQFGVQLHRSSSRAIRLQLEHEVLLRDLQARTEALDIARQDAISANAAKSRFLAHASHDLRQPLHAAGLFLESLDENLGSQRNSDVIQRVSSALGSLSKLFDTLLDVTLLDTGQIEINQQSISLGPLFEQLETEFATIALKANVELRFFASNAVVTSDGFVLRRILQNLLSNAIRNSPGGVVLVGSRRRSGGIEIQVLDNGVGISETDQKLVFEEFTRLAADRTGETSSGLGLGLAIVARLGHMLSLEIGVQSTLGRGSLFSIKGLKLGNSITEAVPLELIDTSTTTLAGKKVWVFDNDIDTLDATVSLLRKWGCEVESSSAEVLSSDEKPDLVICDYEFSANASGLEIINRCREQFADLIPAIIISGNSSPELIGAAKESLIPLLAKPVLAVRLRAALLHVFGGEQTGRDGEGSSRSSRAYA